MQHAFNFTLEKMICLKKRNNNIKIGIFCLYFEIKKMRFFCLYFKTKGVFRIYRSTLLDFFIYSKIYIVR